MLTPVTPPSAPSLTRARRSLLHGVFALFGLLAMLVVASPAAATADFASTATQAPFSTLPNDDLYSFPGRGPQAVTGADGSAYIAWVSSVTGSPQAVVATHPRGGQWTTQVVAPATAVSGGVPIGIDGNGTITILTVDPTSTSLVARSRPRNGSWSAPVAVDSTAGKYAGLALAENTSGQIFVGYRRSTNNGAAWMTCYGSRNAGVWNIGAIDLNTPSAPLPRTFPAIALPSGSSTSTAWVDADVPSVAINEAGKAVFGGSLMYGTQVVTLIGRVTAGSGSMEGKWFNFPAGQNASRVSVDISPDGSIGLGYLVDAVATGQTWLNQNVFIGSWLVGAAAPGAANVTTGTQRSAWTPGVRIAADGTVSQAWTASSDTTNAGEVKLAELSPAGIVSRRGLTTNVGAAFADIQQNPAGDTLVTWANAASGAVQGMFRPAGKADFGDLQTAPSAAPGSAFQPAASVDPEGNAVVASLRQSSTDGSMNVQASGFDAAAPTLRNLVLPTAASTGLPVTFSATADDAWSSPQVTWTFGDGASANGSTASHTFGIPNGYNVAAKATDDVGNVATQEVVVQVSGADVDRDGYDSLRDCNDNDARVHPGAHDVPGNTLDEDCVSGDARFGLLATTVSYAVLTNKSLVSPVKLAVKGVRTGDRIKVVCSGPCRGGKSATRRVKKVPSSAVFDLTDLVKRLRPAPSTWLTITTSREEYLTQVTRVNAYTGKIKTTCQIPRSKRGVKCN